MLWFWKIFVTARESWLPFGSFFTFGIVLHLSPPFTLSTSFAFVRRLSLSFGLVSTSSIVRQFSQVITNVRHRRFPKTELVFRLRFHKESLRCFTLKIFNAKIQIVFVFVALIWAFDTRTDLISVESIQTRIWWTRHSTYLTVD